jgi:hypothetical protein
MLPWGRRVLHKRLADNEPLLDLAGQPLILSTDKKMLPRENGLQWRLTSSAGFASAPKRFEIMW